MRTVGYLCVHGIGVHESGDLTDEALHATELGAIEAGGSLTSLCDDPTAPSELKHRAIVSIPEEEPFLAEFYDGWWDRRVERPNFWVVLFWTLRIAPFAILNAGAHWTEDRAQDEQSSEMRDFLVNATAVGLAGLALGGPALLVTFLLSTALHPQTLTERVPASLVAVVLVLVPILITAWHQPTRETVRSHMVDIIGDAWLYRSEELENAVIPHLEGIARSARSRADDVVLLGHSQGAELTRRVALRGSADRCVWLGSGENQLSMVRTLAKSRVWPFLIWPMLLSWPLVLYYIVIWGFGPVLSLLAHIWEMLAHFWTILTDLPAPAAHHDQLWDSLSAELWSSSLNDAADAGRALAVVLVYGGTAFLLGRWFLRPPPDTTLSPEMPLWAVKSPVDPVSLGPTHPTAQVRYVPPHPKEPWWKEHITYFEKPSAGLVIIESGLAEPRLLEPRQPPWVPAWLLLGGSVLGIGVLIGTWFLGRWQSELIIS